MVRSPATLKIHEHETHGVAHCGRRGLPPERFSAPGRPVTCESCIYHLIIRADTGGKK